MDQAQIQQDVNHNRKKYIELCCRTREKEIENMRTRLEKEKEQIRYRQNSLVSAIRQAEFTETVIGEILKVPSPTSKGLEFDRIIEHPSIENIEFTDTTIQVFTKNIYIKHKSLVYDIGKFCIKLNVDYYSGDYRTYDAVIFLNLTRHIQRYQHPHIDSDGRPCLGNIQECLPSMIGAKQFTAAINVAIQYLKSYSENDSGRPYISLTEWPLKRE